MLPCPLPDYFQSHSDEEGESGSPRPQHGPEDCPIRAESLTWLLGSQGTERGISVCLQDTMYFLGEGRRQPWSLGRPGLPEDLAACAQPSGAGGTPIWPGGLAAETIQTSSEAELDWAGGKGAG